MTLKVFRNGLLSIAGIALFIALSSCQDRQSTVNDFMIKVDSIRLPQSVSANTRFDIIFFGTIGFNGCYSFKTFNRVYDANDISIEAWGTYDSDNRKVCADALVTLDGQILTLSIPVPGTYKIIIKEPFDYVLVEQIVVN